MSVIAKLKVWAPLVTVTPFVRRRRLPPNVYVPPSTVIERKLVKIKKLLLFDCWIAAAGNTRSSPATGATSVDQLAAVVQLASEPPPSHVFVAAKTLADKNKNKKTYK